MDKTIKENVSFYATGIIAIIIAVLGISANTIYSKTGGYALGAGCSAVALLCECFIFATSTKLSKTRSKGILFFTSLLVLIYAILFIIGDLAKVKVYTYAFENGGYVSKLCGFGKIVLAFEIICIILTILFVVRMLLNLFGKEIKFYEKLLGTTVVRYKERESVEIDYPEKDTEKLVASATRALGVDDKLTKAIPEATSKEPLAPPKKKKPTDTKKTVDEKPKHIELKDTPEDATDKKDTDEVRSDETPTKDTITEDSTKIDTVNVDSEIDESDVDEIIDTAEDYSDVVDDDDTYISDDTKVNDIDDIEAKEELIESDTFFVQPENENTQDVEILVQDESDVDEQFEQIEDLGGVVMDQEPKTDVRGTYIMHHITEQVDSEDDDIYDNFNYDDDDE